MTEREAAYDETFRRCFPRAFNLATRLVGDRAVGEEIAAEALARTFFQWHRVRDLPYLDAWIMRVTVNLAIGVQRRSRRPILESLPHAEPDSDSLVVMRAALRHLSRRQQVAVVLREGVGMTTAEVALVMGVSENTAGTHVRRGLMALRQELGVGASWTI